MVRLIMLSRLLNVLNVVYVACLVFGTMIAAVFIQFADYRWIFFLTSILGIPAAFVCLILVPAPQSAQRDNGMVFSSRLHKLKKLDLAGVSILTGAVK